MNQKAFFVAMFAVLVLSLEARFAYGQTYAAAGQELVVTETQSFTNSYLSSKKAEAPQMVADLPGDQVKYTYMRSSNKNRAAANLLPRTEGDYATQVVVVNIQVTGGPMLSNSVDIDTARDIVFNENGYSVKVFWRSLSWGLLRITSRVNASGQATDIFFVTISAPIDNCDFRSLNEYPALIDEQLPAGNKLVDKHANFLVLPEGLYQSGGCTMRASSNVSRVRSMDKGNKIWIPAPHFASSPSISYHELGHTLGLGHSSALANNGSPDVLSWTRMEYGDPACIMATGISRLNSAQADKLGWYQGSMGFRELLPGTYYLVPPSEQRSSVGFKRMMVAQNTYITTQNPAGYRIYPETRQKAEFEQNISQVTNYFNFRVGMCLRINFADVTAAATSSLLVDFGGFDTSLAPLMDENEMRSVMGVDFTLLRQNTAMQGARFSFVYR